jgi:hypothetical protein
MGLLPPSPAGGLSGMSVGALDLTIIYQKTACKCTEAPPYLLWREVLNSHWFRQVSVECAPFFLEYFLQWQQHCTVPDNFYQGASLDFCIALLNLTSKSKLLLYIHFASILNSLVRNLVQSIHQWTHGYKTNCLDSQVHISTTVFGEKFNQCGAKGWWESKTRLTSSRRPTTCCGAHKRVDVQPISSKGWWKDCKTRLSSWGPRMWCPQACYKASRAWKKDFWGDTNACKF